MLDKIVKSLLANRFSAPPSDEWLVRLLLIYFGASGAPINCSLKLIELQKKVATANLLNI